MSAILSGQLIARTGRYKALIVTSLVALSVGLFLLTNLRPDTPQPLVWLWMAVTGLGVGPCFAAFTLVVQNAVPVADLGTGTSSVTLFQQLGGTVGLAITGSIFGSVLLEEVPKQLTAAGVPAQFATQFTSGGASSFNSLTGVGDLGAKILAQVPPAFRSQVEPLIPALVSGIHEAFSLATASTFVVGIITALLAALIVLVVMPAGRMGEHAQGVEPVAQRIEPQPTAD